MDWRLDYSIKSKNAGRENASVFFVSLKVKDRGVVREINMIASIEELQDLLSKVFSKAFLSLMRVVFLAFIVFRILFVL